MKPEVRAIPILLLAVLLLHSCAPSAELPPPTLVAPTVNVPSRFYFPTSTFAPRSTATPRPSETLRPAPSATSTSPAPVETTIVYEDLPLDHPLSIEFLRLGEFPGSPIVFELELEPGGNYSRYYVSYLSEGLRIYALMTIPGGIPPEEGWPVIIFNHGYISPYAYRTTERYVQYVDALASSGYIVFRSDYRGHDLSDGIARGAYGYPDYTIDVLNAVASMKSYPEANPERIGMWGHSMGGFLTLRCMVISPDIKAGVIWAGVVASYPDMVYRWPDQTYEDPELANSWRTTLAAVYGTPAQNPAFWDSISANSYLTQLSGPVQLHHGTRDVEVPVEFSTSLYEKLSFLNKPAELYIYENDNHNLSNHFSLAMRRSIDFFDTYLK